MTSQVILTTFSSDFMVDVRSFYICVVYFMLPSVSARVDEWIKEENMVAEESLTLLHSILHLYVGEEVHPVL